MFFRRAYIIGKGIDIEIGIEVSPLINRFAVSNTDIVLVDFLVDTDIS